MLGHFQNLSHEGPIYNLESLKEYLFTPPVDAPTENLINWPTIFSASTRDDDKAEDDNNDEEDDNDNEQDGGEGNEDGINNDEDGIDNDDEEESDDEEDDEHV